MKKRLLSILALLILAAMLRADSAGILAYGSWRKALRPEHPRLFLTAADLPGLRERIKTVNKAAFERLKKEVDALPADAPFLPDQSLYKVEADGTIKPHRPGFQGARLCKYDGGTQAAQCALMYLLTGDKVYLEKAKSYLKLHAKILKWTADGNVWMDLLGNTRINALAAYDWIYNDLTPAERKELLTPILDYIAKSQPEGGYKFRRTIGGATDGNYGERALEFFAGVVEAGNPDADPRAEAMLERGARLFVEMMDHREKISAGSGLLSAVTVGYTFGAYPYSTFNFIRAWKSAFGADVTGQWIQMSDYPNWFEWSAIKITPDGKFLYYGIGDLEHKDNLMGLGDLYTHFAQAINFYGKAYPDKAARAYALLQRFPERNRVIRTMYPFVPFMIENFDPAEVAKADPDKVPELPYFYAPSFGLLFMRSGKSDADTFASFRFGALNGNHQHYDELSFIIYKYGFLALDSGSRTETDHHHGFAPQSVAHNTILIHEPNEELPPFWKAWSYKPDPSGKVYYNHGGQSYNTLARPIALQSTDRFIYAAGDATKNYREAKSREVVRQFVYLKPDLFVIFDRVESVKPEQKKEFILHTQNRPEKMPDGSWRADHGGRLFIRPLLPADAVVKLEGGPGREFFASGRNWELPGGADWDKPYQLTGKWRMEISAPQDAARTEFLHVLEATSTETPAMVKAEVLETTPATVTVKVVDRAGTAWLLRFNRTGEVGLHLKETGADGKVRFDAELPDQIEKR